MLLSLLSLAVAVHAAPDTTLVYGDRVPTGTVTPLAAVVANPTAHADRKLVVEGVITAVCQSQGCWMRIAPDTTKGALPAHISFDHQFFIPMNTVGMKAKVAGTMSVKVYTPEEVAELTKAGQTIARNAAGEPIGLQFVAVGVELRGVLATPKAKTTTHP